MQHLNPGDVYVRVFTGGGSYPVAALVQSSGVSLTARAWRTKKGFYFPHPIHAILGFTPTLAKYAWLHMGLLGYVAVKMRHGVWSGRRAYQSTQHACPSSCLSDLASPRRRRHRTAQSADQLQCWGTR